VPKDTETEQKYGDPLIVCNQLRYGNALSHKLYMGERRCFASDYTLTTASRTNYKSKNLKKN